MALRSYAVTLRANDASVSPTVGDPAAAVAAASTDADTAATDTTTADTNLGTVVGADQTAVESAIATLETDGASPTQAHVNSLRTVWDTLKTHAATAKTNTVTAKTSAATVVTDLAAAAGDITGDVQISLNPAVCDTRTKLRMAMGAVRMTLEGSDLLAP